MVKVMLLAIAGAVAGFVNGLMGTGGGIVLVLALERLYRGKEEGGDVFVVTVAVTAPTEARVARIMARDGITEEYARSRILAQPSNAYFSENCDYTLENAGSAGDFQRKCLAFLKQLAII